VLFGGGADFPQLVAPMGASAVLLFGVPASPLAQPWSIIGGNLVSATVGVTCAMFVGDPVLAAALGVSISICGMFLLRCVHPPSGAVALTAVLGGPAIHRLGFGFVLTPIFVESCALLAAALAYHAATGHRYPHTVPHDRAKDAKVTQSAQPAGITPEGITPGFTRADLEAVVRRQSEWLDVDLDDLEKLMRETQLQAFARGFGELTAADIMSRRVLSVTRDTAIARAFALLREHNVKALPVTEADGRLAGIVTRANLAASFGERGAGSGVSRLATLFGLTGGGHDDGSGPAVGSVMTSHVVSVGAKAPLTDLVPLFAHHGHHHIPVVDATERVVGMITQVDLISGLYRHSAGLERKVA
jgi:CBS domain-containing membrane protein